jgi:hypothetical protein
MFTAVGIAMVAATPAQADMAGTAEGSVTMNGKRYAVKFARAATLPDEMHKGKEILRVVVSDVPFTSVAMFKDLLLTQLIHGVQIDFHDDGVAWFARDLGSDMSATHTQRPNPFPVKVAGGAAEGSMVVSLKADAHNPEPVEISVKYAAPIEKYVAEPAPVPADAQAAKHSAAANAYRDYIDAIAKGDRARIEAAVPPEPDGAGIDPAQFPELLKMFRDGLRQNVQILKAVEKDGYATLYVAGTWQGAAQKGQIGMRLLGGKWVVNDEAWDE